MPGLSPKQLAAFLKPVVQRSQIRKGGHHLPEPVTRVAHVFLDLPLLPTRSRIAKVRVKNIMARHCHKARIHITLLAYAHPVHRSAHIIVDPPAGHSVEDPEGMPMCIKQHLMGLQQIRADQKRPTVRQLNVGHLQFGTFPINVCPIFAPVELESLSLVEH